MNHITLKRTVGLLLFVAVAYMIVKVKPYKVMTNSMADVIQSNDYVFIFKSSDKDSFKRGDIVAFHKSKEDSITFIKRIAAVEGDTIFAKRNELNIKGRTIPHDPIYEMLVSVNDENDKEYDSRRYFEFLIYHMDREDSLSLLKFNITEYGNGVIVPEGSLFMVGDNAYDSMDSRFWGFIPNELVLGKVFAIF